MNIWITIGSGLLIILGTLGAVLPFLPGLPVAWIGLLVYAWSTDFTRIGVWGLVVFGLLTAFTVVVDIIAPALAAKGHKASRMGVMGALIGGLIGVFLLGPLGILLGPFVGAFLGEMMHAANTDRALRVALASLLGLVIGSAFKLIIGTSMMIYFLIQVL